MTLTSRNGKLWITFYHQSQRYRRTLNLDDTKANRKLAEKQIIPELIYKLNTGEFFKNENVKKVPTVGEYAEVSIELHKSHRKQSTMVRLINNLKKHILPYFGDKRLDKIKPSNISLWQNKLLNDLGLSSKRVKDLRTTLSVILEDAVCDEIIESNPVAKASKLPFQRQKEIEPFSMNEIKAILTTANEPFKNFFAVGFFTGMRTGEILGLKWSDINFDKNIISIKRAVERGNVTTPKTVGSIREIIMLDILKPYLLNQYKLTGKQKSFVFLTNNDSHYFDSNKIRDYSWKNTLKDAGVKYRTLYNTRHTFASMMISNGEDPLWVSNMLGHSSFEMTFRKYAKFIKGEDKKRATFLNNGVLNQL